MQESEIAAKSKYKIRPIIPAEYTAKKAALVAAANSIGFLWPNARYFLNSFCYNTPLDGANVSTVKIGVNSLDHNVGVLFAPNGSGDAFEYKSTMYTAISDKVATSVALTRAINIELLQAHSYEVSNYNFGTELAHDFQWKVGQSSIIFAESSVTSLDLEDDDLHLVMNQAGLNLTIVVTVRASDKNVVKIRCIGNVYDTYDFDWESGGLLGAPVNQAGAAVQAGYDSLGEGGHIFKVNIEFDKIRYDIQHDFSIN